MRPVGAAQAEGRAEVVDQVSLLLEGCKKSLIDGLLVLHTVLCGLLLLRWMLVKFFLETCKSTHLWLLALLEESILSGFLGLFVLGEVTVLASLGQDCLIDSIDIHLGRCGDDIASVYPSQGNAIDFERAGDEEDTLG